MTFGTTLRATLALLSTIGVVCVTVFLSLARVLPNRSGVAFLLFGIVIVCSFVVTLVVPVAAYRLFRNKASRTPVNIGVTLAGVVVAMPFLALWYLFNH